MIKSKYFWTQHALRKMKFYQLSESRVRRVIKSPLRIEEGIAYGTIAVMQPSSYKVRNNQKTWSQEIWVMYQIDSPKPSLDKKNKEKGKGQSRIVSSGDKLIKIISAWRYPGKTNPGRKLPPEVINEIEEALNSL